MIRGTVAILGRPNVGKSTLFNRLTRSMQALIDDRPGVTRDRLYGICEFETEDNEGCVVIDTGGFETKGYAFQPFSENIVWQQTELAVQEADLVLFVLDGREGLHTYDRALLQHLRENKKNFLTIINKVDGRDQDIVAAEFYALGLDQFIFVTATHNEGIDELREAMREQLALGKRKIPRKAKHELSLAIIGKPNAGKSSLLNRLAGEDRSLVSEVAGTTRDAIDATVTRHDTTFRLIDTAGVRRRSKIQDKVESLSVMRSFQMIEQADVVLLVLDALEGLTDQDARLAELVVSQFKPLLIVMNKWDLVPNKKSNTAKEYQDAIYSHLKMMSYVPVEFVSCLTNLRVHSLLDEAKRLFDMSRQRVKTAQLNATLEKIVEDHTPALIRNYSKRVKFYYGAQVRVAPPTIVVFTNAADDIDESYKRYVVSRLRENLNLQHVPLRVLYRDKNKKRGKSSD